MSRFDLAAKTKADNEKAIKEMVSKAKNVRQIRDFDSTGEFNGKAKVADFGFGLYSSCPQKNCRRKVNDEKLCSGCARYVKEPDVSMFLKLKLEDLIEDHILQDATMFCAVAEHFLGIKAKELQQMSDEERDQALAPLLGRKIAFKVAVKEPKNDDFSDGSLEWQIKKFADLVIEEKEAGEKEEDEIVEVDGPPAAKKSKKNAGGSA